MQGLRCRVYFYRVEHLQGLTRDGLTFKIARTDMMEHIQGLLYIGSIIDVVEYKRS